MRCLLKKKSCCRANDAPPPLSFAKNFLGGFNSKMVRRGIGGMQKQSGNTCELCICTCASLTLIFHLDTSAYLLIHILCTDKQSQRTFLQSHSHFAQLRLCTVAENKLVNLN